MTHSHGTAPHWAWRTWGDPDRPTLLLLHGFTGRAAFWAPLAEPWAARWFVMAPDLPGHGDSGAPGPAYGLAEAAEAVADKLRADGREGVTVMGYSLGGRLALHLATAHPERVSRLVLIGASAGLPDAAARAERRASDAGWATVLREEGLAVFLDAWESLPLFEGHGRMPEARRRWLRDLRAGQRAEGLAASLEAFGLGSQSPLQDALSSLTVPTWWMAGERDTKFAAIAEQMADRMPSAWAVLVPRAGHNVPFEQPQALTDFVDALERSSRVGSP
jgi:2-succinyl-6-hydroxy-2,4-cyclohexadiene-1-carboxylate synthase